jgi:diadenylate cyclase
MQYIGDRLAEIFANFSWVQLIEIFLYFVIIAVALVVLKTNNAKRVIVYYCVFTVLLSIVLIAIKAKNNSFNGAIYMVFLQALFIIAVIVMFATEVKRAIWNHRRANDYRHGESMSDDVSKSIEEIIKAVQNMSKNDVGAIIILSNGNLPSSVLESGVYLDADISSELIESVFFPKTPLHDGAMILCKNKIQAAGCFLPLAQEVNMSKEFGSRHRAGIGLTETVDVSAIIVSEETGIISIAKGGKITRYVDTNMLRQALRTFYWQYPIEQ